MQVKVYTEIEISVHVQDGTWKRLDEKLRQLLLAAKVEAEIGHTGAVVTAPMAVTYVAGKD